MASTSAPSRVSRAACSPQPNYRPYARRPVSSNHDCAGFLGGLTSPLHAPRLAGNQPGGEGTGKALGVNDTSLFGVLLAIPVIIGVLFSQWQDYQDDDDDFFDSYDSRRDDKELTNRNRV